LVNGLSEGQPATTTREHWGKGRKRREEFGVFQKGKGEKKMSANDWGEGILSVRE